jgi:hypothetical protein
MQRALRIICQVCGDTGWVQAAPVEESDTLDRKYIRNAFVGTFHPMPCFCQSSNVKVLTP